MRKCKKITKGGESLTAEEWSKRAGIKRRLIFDRIYRGWSKERAVSEGVNSHTHYFTHKGKTLSNKEWAKIAGISPDAFFMRVTKLKWDFERALTTPLRGKEELPEFKVNERALPGQRMSFSL